MKKCLEILFLYIYMCTINEDHMIYGSWNIRCDRQKFLSFWAIFCPFSPLTTQKIPILTLEKKTWKYYHFTNVHHTWQSYDIWFLRYEVQQIIFCHFGPFFALLPPTNPKNQNFEKKKMSRHIIILHICTINNNHMMYGS